MMQRTKISIALTTYNGERYLREQLDSLYAQSLPVSEVVVCDDGSTDGTLSILEEYHQKKGLIYHVNKPSLGINRNFMKAIEMCQGDYVALCDQDDVWMPDKIEKSYQQLQQWDKVPAVVSTSKVDVNAQLQPIKIKSYGIDQRLSSSILFNTCSQGCTLLLNKRMVEVLLSLVKQHLELLDCTYYDALIGITAASIGHKINLPDRTLYYRHHATNAVGKEQMRHTQKELISLRPRYHYSLPDDRLICLQTIYPTIKEQISSPQVHRLYHEAQQILTASNLWLSLWRLLWMHDVSLSRKLRIITFSGCNQILRYVSQH